MTDILQYQPLYCSGQWKKTNKSTRLAPYNALISTKWYSQFLFRSHKHTKTASFTKWQSLGRLLTLRKPYAAEMTHIPLPTSVNHHEEVNISKYGENMKTVLRAISVWFAFSLECHTLWASVTTQSQLCGAYLSLEIIMMIVENFLQLFWVWQKMGT